MPPPSPSPQAGAHPLDQYLQGNLGSWGAHNEAGAKTQSLSEMLGSNVKLFPEPRLFWSRGLSVGSAGEWVCAQPAFLTSLVAQRLKHLPTMWETQVQSLVWEDPLEKKWQPTPVLLPGKFHGRRSVVGYSPWGRKESDTTELLHFHTDTPQRYYRLSTG